MTFTNATITDARNESAAQDRPILWTYPDLIGILGGEALNLDAPHHAILGVSINTRTLEKGDVFIAIKGENNDGHDYVKEAFEKGASAAIVETNSCNDNPDWPLIKVESAMKALIELGQAARGRCVAKRIGITGSVGKTGTKELLKAGFSAIGRAYASAASHNNHWGVPLSLAGLHPDTDFGIFEMGMNHAGEIAPLTAQVVPHIAIITTIAAVHIEAFEDGIEGIAREKAEIFSKMADDGIAILPRDNDHYDLLKSIASEKGVERILSFGEHENADARLISCLVAANGSRVKANILGEDIEYTLGIAGKHIALNSLAVLLSVAVSDGDIQKAAKEMGKVEPVKGRGTREHIETSEKNNPITLIDESYNASPVAMRAAFKVLAMIDPGRGGRRIAVLGDMRELGSRGAQLHKELAIPLQAEGIDLVYTSGPLMKNLHDELPQDMRGKHTEDSSEMAQIVPDVLTPGDVVMVKGSLGSKMNIVVEALRKTKV